jgi:hypothetical protein
MKVLEEVDSKISSNDQRLSLLITNGIEIERAGGNTGPFAI